MRHRVILVILCAWILGIVGFSVPVATTVYAQVNKGGGYLAPIPIDPNLQDRQKGNRDAMAMKSRVLSGVAPFDDAGRLALRTYYEGYLFKAMTHPENYGSLQDIRKTTLNEIRNSAARSAEVQKFMVDLVFAQMRPLVEQNFHPIVRVNAMLFIGELNQVEKGPGIDYPTPMASVLPYLREQLKNPAQIDAVRVAALAGIHRHVESFWFNEQTPPADVISGLTQEMVDLVQSAPPPGRSADAHAWMQGRAIDILGSLGGWSPQDAAFQAITKVLADTKNPLTLRCRAAVALSRLNYANLAGANTADWPSITGSLAGVLADACKQEVAWIETQKEKKQAAAGSAVFGGVGPTGGGFAPPGGGPLGPPGGSEGFADDGDAGTGAADLFGGGGLGPPGMMPGMGGPSGFGASSLLGGLEKYQAAAVQRRLLYELLCVKSALNGPGPNADVQGVKPIASANQAAAPMIQKLETAIAEIEKVATAKELDVNAMVKVVRTRGKELELLRPVSAAPPASDVPGSDVPSSDVPASDVPASDVPAPAKDAAADVPGAADVPPQQP